MSRLSLHLSCLLAVGLFAAACGNTPAGPASAAPTDVAISDVPVVAADVLSDTPAPTDAATDSATPADVPLVPDGLQPDVLPTDVPPDDVPAAELPPADVPPADNAAPTIAFTNVFNGTKVSADFDVKVDAKDDIGVVSVTYYLNGTEIDTINAAPFTWTWKTTTYASGNWFLKAIAKDASGKVSDPAEVEVTVQNTAATCGEAPQVKIVYPTDKATVCGDLGIETSASGPCGVKKVEFFVDGLKIGEASDKPYKTPWKTGALKDGQHYVKAVATDSAGQAGQQTIQVKVDNKQTQCVNPPTVFITKPDDEAYLFGIVAVEAEASTGGDTASLVNVNFSFDGGKAIKTVDTFPYSVDWDTDKVSEGPHTLKAVAKDNFDKLGVHQITVTVDRTDPKVASAAPDSNAVVNGDTTPLTVAADASDNLALVNVGFSAQSPTGGSIDLGVVTKKPWQVLWNTASAASGNWVLKATAMDAAGHGASDTRAVVVDRDPTISIGDPNGSGTLSGTVQIDGEAKDDLGIQDGVTLRIDGKDAAVLPLGNSATFFAYSWSWDTTLAAYGDHPIEVEVIDSNGHKATAKQTVKVDQPYSLDVQVCGDTAACMTPTDWLAAYPETTGSLTLKALPKDDNATTTKVELLVGSTVVQTLTAEPWTIKWDSTTVTDGSHELSVKATSSLGDTKTVAFSTVVNNCDLDHDKHLATGGACGGDDCNDADKTVFAGAPDAVGDGTDQNCDGLDGVDADGDKFASLASGGKDCNDFDKLSYPGAVDTVGDGTDENCDGVDGVDADGDGYASIASGGKDCNDALAGVHPGAADFMGPACDTVTSAQQKVFNQNSDTGSFLALAVGPSGSLHTACTVTNAYSTLGYVKYSGSSWPLSTADSTASVGEHVSLAVDASATAAIAYYDGANYKLKVAYEAMNGTWSYVTPDSQKLTGQYTSIARVGAAVHVAYYDFGNYRLKYATNASGSWVAEYVDTATNVGEYASLKVAKDGTVHIAYYDGGKKALKHAWGKGGSWQVEAVDSTGDAGKYASLALDDKGGAHIAYYAASTKDLRYASQSGGKWTTETAFATGSVGKFASLGLVPGTWGAVVAFIDEGAAKTMVGWRGPAGWTAQALDGNVAAGAISLAVRPDASVAVAYYAPAAHAMVITTAGCTQTSAGGVDDNCDGIDGVDADGDKYASLVSGGKDCDDANAAAHPCADEPPNSAVDLNCDATLAVSCNDCSACTKDALAQGICSHTPIAEGAVCDDGDACTVGEKCTTGQCASGTALGCDDGSVCTADSCQAVGGCLHVATEGGCNLDGTACTPDVCAAGVCKAVAAVNCDDGNACNTDACDVVTGACTHVALGDGTGCTDGDACTVTDTCQAGVCKAGTAMVCSVSGQTCVAGVCKAAAPDGMVLIPAGTFWMGCNSAKDTYCNGYSSEKPQHKVTLSAYYMDVNEITEAQYKKCVDAGVCSPATDDPYGYGGCSAGVAGKEQNPVNCVTWTHAQQYCKWRGAGFDLPTEAQWEMAARGDCVKNGSTAGDAACAQAMRTYPWGEAAPTASYAVFNTSSTAAVGSIPAGDSPYGLHDMAGNVWEWNRDWYGSYSAGDQTDPTGPASASYRVNRGGSFDGGYADDLRAGVRFGGSPSSASVGLGARCSRSFP